MTDTIEPRGPKYDGWIAVLIWIACATLPWAVIGGIIWSAAP